ncbi:substrate-binding domain-containing protein [Bradyrhizobium sp. CSA112]|uniref:LacI family DNA-binding transcriptional regulator n=1 Tax=Bradyrhizobium sp. CSA112 TaxID=2699170 RepID=UPI0023B0A4E7|nr:LacI family DNA-binding transcriptional regulator [Bradyrhizobium sp. CSA112]MDE5451759.1 substrate-binding domain-containing protein [Bradyrhizobium sp. CSA112]
MSAGPLPTIHEVARLAGVSVATVSKTLNRSGKVSEVLQERVNAAAQKLGYAPHASARSLRSGATRILGLLVADLTNPYFLRLVENIERLSSAAGYSVILCNSAEDPEREERHLAMLLSQRADGAIVIPTRRGWSGRLAALSSLPMPGILVDRRIEGLDLDSVTTDNLTLGRLAAEHLDDLGHRRVGVIMGSPEHQIARHRLDGFRTGFAERGVTLDERLIEKNNFSEMAGHAAALRLLSRSTRPTAIFATNNHLALGLLRAVGERGLSIPDELSVIAVDELPWAGLVRPGMTVVTQPSEAIAETTVSTLLRRISEGRSGMDEDDNERSIQLPPALVVRGSTAAIRKQP